VRLGAFRASEERRHFTAEDAENAEEDGRQFTTEITENTENTERDWSGARCCRRRCTTRIDS
jgi:hypothetical protein